LIVTTGAGTNTINIGGVVDDNVTIRLGNAGNTDARSNIVTFAGAAEVRGTFITIIGGTGRDRLFLDALDADSARLTAFLQGGNDFVRLNGPAVDLASAFLDGGTGNNVYVQIGTIDFPLTLRNFS
jgi:hypothetical protein